MENTVIASIETPFTGETIPAINTMDTTVIAIPAVLLEEISDNSAELRQVEDHDILP